MTQKEPKIKENDLGMNAIIRNLKDLKGKGVKVGVQGVKGTQIHDNSENKSVVDIAVVHEFGKGKIPERSFLRASYNKNKNKWLKENKKIINDQVLKSTTKSPLFKLLGQLGSQLQKDVRAYIRKGINPPNHPSTLKKKLKLTAKGNTKTPKPLIHTGQLIEAIHWAAQVKKK
mgnify:CR=1 FL=1